MKARGKPNTAQEVNGRTPRQWRTYYAVMGHYCDTCTIRWVYGDERDCENCKQRRMSYAQRSARRKNPKLNKDKNPRWLKITVLPAANGVGLVAVIETDVGHIATVRHVEGVDTVRADTRTGHPKVVSIRPNQKKAS